MNVFRRIKAALGFGPKLRNRCNGMAWVKGVSSSVGAEQLNGRAVKTVRIDRESGLWVIDPPQSFICTRSCLFGLAQSPIVRGRVVTVACIADDLLEPWREIGDGEKDESAEWLPPVPTQRKEPSHA